MTERARDRRPADYSALDRRRRPGRDRLREGWRISKSFPRMRATQHGRSLAGLHRRAASADGELLPWWGARLRNLRSIAEPSAAPTGRPSSPSLRRRARALNGAPTITLANLLETRRRDRDAGGRRRKNHKSSHAVRCVSDRETLNIATARLRGTSARGASRHRARAAAIIDADCAESRARLASVAPSKSRAPTRRLRAEASVPSCNRSRI